jgi:hypothetical protein
MCEDEHHPFSDAVIAKRTCEFSAVSLSDVIQEFEYFLKGSGFQINGTLDIVPFEECDFNPDANLELYDTMDLPKHSPYYYDTERNK